MIKITFIAATGEAQTVEAKVGSTVMEAAVKNGVDGITAECGGACACATCRVYPDDSWRSKIDEASDMELGMLEFAEDAESCARLSCQIKVTEALDGLVVRLPKSQH